MIAPERSAIMLQRLIPKIFYDDLDEGLDFFVDGLGFEILHQDEDLAVVERDGAKAYLVASPEFAAKDRPEIAIETDAIGVQHVEIRSRRPDLLHPNGRNVTKKPWGALEFAVRDVTGVCVIFRQWPASE
jgi:catechol 2,3-dioxygenase-like lactoylglutathione lyase family enzyme